MPSRLLPSKLRREQHRRRRRSKCALRQRPPGGIGIKAVEFNPRSKAAMRKYLQLVITALSLTLCFSVVARAQHTEVQKPTASPTPQAPEQEPSVKVFTEEVRLPVIAVDQYGHYDPTLNLEDILVLEDGVAQQIKSVRRIPPSVVVMLDTGGELSGLGGQSKRTSLTRDVAVALLNQIKPGTWLSVMQFNNSVDTLQPWTTDKQAAIKALKTKLSSGKRARFSDALAAAALNLPDRPE